MAVSVRIPRRLLGGDWLSLASSFALTLHATLYGIVLLMAMVPGWRAVVVQSGSMEPLLHTGDIVLVRAVEDPAPGEVVLVERSGKTPLLHRLVTMNADEVGMTQGDANAAPDSTPVRSEEIAGIGRVALPAIGMPSVWIAQRSPLPLILGVAVELLILTTAAHGVLRHRRFAARVSGFEPLTDRHLAELEGPLPAWVQLPRRPLARSRT